MVVGGRASDDRADRIFRALADRTRRDIVRRAMGGTLSVSGLARLYPMSTTAVQKHVAVLGRPGSFTGTAGAVSSSSRPISTPSPRRQSCSPNSSSCGVIDSGASVTWSPGQNEEKPMTVLALGRRAGGG
jgi:hypothetical protein